MVSISDKDVAGAFNGPDKEKHKKLLDEVKKLPKPAPPPKAMAISGGDSAQAKTFILRRGEYSQPLDEVTAGFPTVLRGPSSTTAQNQRSTLASWIASRDNPLSARVMVNRIWQHHFGRGLVATPGEFGTHGARPTHPELLDWLASEFIANGWSIKKMHKLMLTSETYQQRSDGRSEGWNDGSKPQAQSSNTPPFQPSTIPSPPDPGNSLLWRMNRLRLEGEVVRDSLLAISGQLNPAMGGPGVFPPVPKEVSAGSKGGWPQNDRQRDYSRRSVYIFARRNPRFQFLEVFDAPDSNLSCPVRERSTTAPQSLTLLNADEVMTAAALTAERLQKEADSADGQIALAYRLVLGRKPNENELSLARQFLAKSPLHEFCRALFNLNDFVYAE